MMWFKGGLVPACNDVGEISPPLVKVQFGEISAVECGFTIGGLEWQQTSVAIVDEFQDIVA